MKRKQRRQFYFTIHQGDQTVHFIQRDCQATGAVKTPCASNPAFTLNVKACSGENAKQPNSQTEKQRSSTVESPQMWKQRVVRWNSRYCILSTKPKAQDRCFCLSCALGSTLRKQREHTPQSRTMSIPMYQKQPQH